jgi:hypothetical protein
MCHNAVILKPKYIKVGCSSQKEPEISYFAVFTDNSLF